MYRTFALPTGVILLGVRLQLHRKPQKEILAEIRARLKHKKATQPLALAAVGASGRTPTTTTPRSCSRRPGSGASAWAAPDLREARELHHQSRRRHRAGRHRSPGARVRARPQPDGVRLRRSSESWAIEPSTDRPTRYGQHHRGLSGPRARPVPPEDLASRARLMANQRRRSRHVSRLLRVPVRALALGLTLTGLGVAAFVAWDWVLRTLSSPPAASRSPAPAGSTRLRSRRPPASSRGRTSSRSTSWRPRRAWRPPRRPARARRAPPARPGDRAGRGARAARFVNAGLHWVDAEGYLVTTDARPARPACRSSPGSAPRRPGPARRPRAWPGWRCSTCSSAPPGAWPPASPRWTWRAPRPRALPGRRDRGPAGADAWPTAWRG